VKHPKIKPRPTRISPKGLCRKTLRYAVKQWIVRMRHTTRGSDKPIRKTRNRLRASMGDCHIGKGLESCTIISHEPPAAHWLSRQRRSRSLCSLRPPASLHIPRDEEAARTSQRVSQTRTGVIGASGIWVATFGLDGLQSIHSILLNLRFDFWFDGSNNIHCFSPLESIRLFVLRDPAQHYKGYSRRCQTFRRLAGPGGLTLVRCSKTICHHLALSVVHWLWLLPGWETFLQ